MSLFSRPAIQAQFPRRIAIRIGLLLVTSCLATAALVFPIAIRPSSYPLDLGGVSSQDIQAPRLITYQSKVLTDQARVEAATAIAPVYSPADTSIARKQIEKLRVALSYISTVRADSFSTQPQKLSDISQLAETKLRPETASLILTLNDSRWLTVQQESLNVLEQVMRITIRDDRLDDARRSISSLVSFSIPQDQAAIVTELVSGFTVPNSLYSAEQTDAARLGVRQSVAPINRTYAAGETIVQRGQIVTPVIWEALQQYDLVRPKNQDQGVLAAACLIAVVTVFLGLFFYRRRPAPLEDFRSLGLIAVTFLIFLFGARYVIPNRTVLPYIYPLPAFGLTIAALFNVEIGLVLSLVLSILSAYALTNSLELTLFYTMTSLCGVLVLGKAHRVGNFFWAGIAIGVSGAAIILAYRLSDPVIDWFGIATLAGTSFLNGLAAGSLALLIQFLFSQLLGLTTGLQLLEIARPDHPLLQLILRSAPGTYQHSLQVANLAEQAAERIGADALLTRVGSIYHDAGKALNPLFFIENQPNGHINPHDDLDPVTSAATIIHHVQDGLTLARKYRLPPGIRNFISEHHGTLLTKYQYNRALQIAGDHPETVLEDHFKYPGPRPQSRETALLMLADGCEARARAELPKDETELRKLIYAVFDRCQKEGQLDDTRLTLRDLSLAADSFTATLLGVYHQRIIYPETPLLPASSQLPTQPLNGSRELPNHLPPVQPIAPAPDQP